MSRKFLLRIIEKALAYVGGAILGFVLFFLQGIEEFFPLEASSTFFALNILLFFLVSATVVLGTLELFLPKKAERFRSIATYIYGIDIGGGILFLVYLVSKFLNIQ